MAKIISFSIPQEDSLLLNSLQKELRLQGRSELIRAALNSLKQETDEQKKLSGTVHAVLTVSHNHDDNITSLVHHHGTIVHTHLHHHIRKECLDLFLIEGKANQIRDLLAKIRQSKKIIKVKLATL